MRSDELLSRVRRSSSFSVRKLAEDADVAGTTITRIQSGRVDPSMETLGRILNAAGFELLTTAVRSGGSPRVLIGDLSDAWELHRGRLELNWTRWRGLLDLLALHPDWVPEAVYAAPPPSGHPTVDSLLAAVAEKLADDASLPRPSWTEQVPALVEPYVPTLARPDNRLKVPTQLADRGLMIDATSLWRDPGTIGV